MTLGNKIANISMASGLLYGALCWDQLTAIAVAGLMILIGIFITFGVTFDEIKADLDDQEGLKNLSVFFIQALGGAVIVSIADPTSFLALLPIVTALLIIIKLIFNFIFIPLTCAHYHHDPIASHSLSDRVIYQKREFRWTAIFIATISAAWYICLFDGPLINDIALMIGITMIMLIGMEASFKSALKKNKVKQERYFRIINQQPLISRLEMTNDLSMFVFSPLMWLFLDFPFLASYACVFSILAFYAFSVELAKNK